MNTINKSRMVHLCFLGSKGERYWFVKTDQKFNQTTGQWVTVPIADDDPAKSVPMSFEYAQICVDRWQKRPLNLDVRITLEPGDQADFIDPAKSDLLIPFPHEDCLVTVDADGNLLDSLDAPCVYRVRAVHTTKGPMFCLRFESPELQAQAQFSSLEEGPEMAVARAIERGYHQWEKPLPNPTLEARRAEQAAAQARVTKQIYGLRPGSRG